jgi:drug/metabolite transporter (DMT)-like permease
MPLGPLWVWLAFGEAPGSLTLIGGAVVATAILIDLWAMPTTADHPGEGGPRHV